MINHVRFTVCLRFEPAFCFDQITFAAPPHRSSFIFSPARYSPRKTRCLIKDQAAHEGRQHPQPTIRRRERSRRPPTRTRCLPRSSATGRKSHRQRTCWCVFVLRRVAVECQAGACKSPAKRHPSNHQERSCLHRTRPRQPRHRAAPLIEAAGDKRCCWGWR